MAAPTLLIAAMCLFAMAGLLWAAMPAASEAGMYSSSKYPEGMDRRAGQDSDGGSVAAGGKGPAAAAGDTATESLTTGSLTAYLEVPVTKGEGAGADVSEAAEMRAVAAETARGIAWNWMDGKMTDAEYFAAMSYMHRMGHLDGGGSSGGGDGDGALDGDGQGSPNGRVDGHEYGTQGGLDGPPGAVQDWCKDGLEQRTAASTGEMVCVPYGYADMDVGARWIEQDRETTDQEVGTGMRGVDGDDDDVDGDKAKQPRQSMATFGATRHVEGTADNDDDDDDDRGVRDGPARSLHAEELEAQVADLEQLNDGLMRTIVKLQEALMEAYEKDAREGSGNGGVAMDGVGMAGQAGQAIASQPPLNMAQAAAAQDSKAAGSMCLHGTDASFTTVVDPTMLSGTDGLIGAIPMPDGRYTILLTTASSSPVSVGILLEGDAGLTYDRTFILADTGRPPGADKTMWDYNSGTAELVVGEAQMVNVSATVLGGDGLPVFAALAKCR